MQPPTSALSAPPSSAPPAPPAPTPTSSDRLPTMTSDKTAQGVSDAKNNLTTAVGTKPKDPFMDRLKDLAKFQEQQMEMERQRKLIQKEMEEKLLKDGVPGLIPPQK